MIDLILITEILILIIVSSVAIGVFWMANTGKEKAPDAFIPLVLMAFILIAATSSFYAVLSHCYTAL